MNATRTTRLSFAGLPLTMFMIVVSIVFACTSCERENVLQTVQHEKASVEFSDHAFAIIEAKCLACHNEEPFPAGFDFRTKTSVATSQLGDWAFGISRGLAPFGVPLLSVAERETLMAYGPAAEYDPPQFISWRLSDALAAWPSGSFASPGPGFGIVIEDLHLEGVSGPSAWTVQDIGSSKALEVNQLHHPVGSLPSSYWFPALEYHGEIVEATVTGTVELGRWASVGLGAQDLLLGGRAGRLYGCRLQMDRDSISLRSAPTTQEAYPWYNDPDHSLTGNLVASGFYINGLVDFEFKQVQLGDRVRYEGRVWRNGNQLADLWGESERDAGVPGGFFLHKYSLGNATFIEVELQATTSTQTTDVPE